MPNDCWGGDGMYVNPYCPDCNYNVISYMWLDHVRDEHNGVDPSPKTHPRDDR